MKENCIFCGIVAGTIPSERVLETDEILAFRDIDPAAPVHVLVIPKQHAADSIAQLSGDGESLSALVDAARMVAEQEQITDGWRLITNVGGNAGQTVFHVHLHVLGGWDTPRTSL